jgi:ACT domain-containing protein
MKVCEIWAVAAVYILENGTSHYKDITDYIKETGITGLCKRRGVTPPQTVRSVLGKKDEVFYLEAERSGCYSIKNAAKESIKKNRDVQRVYRQLELKKKIAELKKRFDSLKNSASSVIKCKDDLPINEEFIVEISLWCQIQNWEKEIGKLKECIASLEKSISSAKKLCK